MTSNTRHGFTLVELLVVLVVLALAAAMLAPRLTGLLQPDPAKTIPSDMQEKIDRMRSDAIFKAHIEYGVIDYLDNSLTIDGVVWSPPPGWQFIPQDAPEGSEDEDSSAHAPDQEIDRIELQFAPDGTAKPVHFGLQGKEPDQGWIFDVSAMTGRLTIRPLREALDHEPA